MPTTYTDFYVSQAPIVSFFGLNTFGGQTFGNGYFGQLSVPMQQTQSVDGTDLYVEQSTP